MIRLDPDNRIHNSKDWGDIVLACFGFDMSVLEKHPGADDNLTVAEELALFHVMYCKSV